MTTAEFLEYMNSGKQVPAEQHFYFRIHNKNPEPTLCRFRVLVIISVCIELHEKCVRLFHFESYECMRVFIELDFPPCV